MIKGTVKTEGYHWVNPYFSFTKISLRSNNLNGETLKVNDKSGNSIQIAAVVVWKVKNTAKAIFDVVNYENCYNAITGKASGLGLLNGKIFWILLLKRWQTT